MILLDTHIFVWWMNHQPSLSKSQLKAIEVTTEIAVSAISLWEIAKLAENGRLALSIPVLDWIQAALSYPTLRLIPLSPEIIVQSTQLPGLFHKDPADQLIVATAMQLGIPLLTKDSKILNYHHIKTIA